MLMSEEKTCAVFGVSDVNITNELYAKATVEIFKSIGLGCRVFYFVGYGDFDDLCYKIVTKIKEEKYVVNLYEEPIILDYNEDGASTEKP